LRLAVRALSDIIFIILKGEELTHGRQIMIPSEVSQRGSIEKI